MMSSIGGQRRTLMEAVRHVNSLGGMRAYYRGLAVSCRNYLQGNRGLIFWAIDRVARRVPVFRNRHEHFRGVEAGLRAVDGRRGTRCPGPARFWQRVWECWRNERVSLEPGSDEAAGFWIPGTPPTLRGRMGCDLKDVQPEGGSWVLYRFRADAGEGHSRSFDILHGLRTK